jgi:hypothetical protein
VIRVRLMLAVAVTGCTLYDGRPSIELEPAVIAPTAWPFEVTVRGRGGSYAQLVLDGKDLGGPIPLNVPTWIDTSRLVDGIHRLRARLDDVPYPVESSERTFALDRAPPHIYSEPLGGVIESRVPIVAEIRAEDAVTGLVDFTVEVDTSVVGDASARVVKVDPRTFRVEASGTLDQVRGVFLNVRATDAVGNQIAVGWGWLAPSFGGGGFYWFDPYRPIRGIVSIRGWIQPSWEVPSVIDLFAGGIPVAEAPNVGNTWEVSWNTTNVPDGTYHLELGSVGWYPRLGGPTVAVDNTPPVFQGCTVPPEFSGAVSVHAPVSPAANETLTWGGDVPEMRIDGTSVGVTSCGTGYDQGWCTVAGVQVPAVLDVFFPEGTETDLAGNPMPAGQCTLPLPEWVTPAGSGAMRFGGVTLEAAAATVDVTTGLPQPAFVAWIPSPAAAGAGELMVNGEIMNVEPGSTASDPQLGSWGSLAWIERAAGGPGHVYFHAAFGAGATGPLNAAANREARDLAIARSDTSEEIAWTEDTPQGGRIIWTSVGAGGAYGPVTDDPSVVTEAPAVDSYRRVAYVERAAGGANLVWVRVPRADGSGWDPLGGIPMNRDLAQAAGEPTIVSTSSTTIVAWTEAGQVLAREWTGAAWGDPVVLNADAARPARAPRFQGTWWPDDVWLVFVEDTASGEQIRARRFEGGAWRLIDSPVNAGVPGPVATLSVHQDAPLSVVWTDLAGRVYLRSYNE